VLVALAGMASVLAVQAQANVGLKRSNDALVDANKRVRTANDDLMAANARERARFDLAMDAVKLFHGEVSEDFLLKGKPFEALRTRLLRGAADFYTRLEDLLKGQSDRPSRTALARAYDELAELTEKIGAKPDALAVRRKALGVHRELADSADADLAARADLARSLIAVGSLQEETGDRTGALASYGEARRLSENATATDRVDAQLRAVLALNYYRMGRVLGYYERSAQWLGWFERALSIQQELADVYPAVTQYHRDLAQTLDETGKLVTMTRTGKQDEGLAFGERALMIRRKLAEVHPGLPELQFELASSYIRVGYQQQLCGKSAEAISSFERARSINRELAEAQPNVTEFQNQQAECHDGIAWVLRLTGKPVAALAAFQRAMVIYRKLADAHPSVVGFQEHLAVCLGDIGAIRVEAGRAAEAEPAIRQEVEILERFPTLGLSDLYNLACGYANLARIATMPGSGMTAAEGQAAADQAMQWLSQALAAGYHNMAVMRRDHDLDPLRSRPDFQLLMMDLEFPDDPFARGD
jgi:serine/threonine-protein kinase